MPGASPGGDTSEEGSPMRASPGRGGGSGERKRGGYGREEDEYYDDDDEGSEEYNVNTGRGSPRRSPRDSPRDRDGESRRGQSRSPGRQVSGGGGGASPDGLHTSPMTHGYRDRMKSYAGAQFLESQRFERKGGDPSSARGNSSRAGRSKKGKGQRGDNVQQSSAGRRSCVCVCVCVCECYVSIVFVRKHEVWPWEVLRVYRICPRAVSVSIESSRSCSMHKLYQWLLVHLYDC